MSHFFKTKYERKITINEMYIKLGRLQVKHKSTKIKKKNYLKLKIVSIQLNIFKIISFELFKKSFV